MTMPYWVGFQVWDGSRRVDLKSFDSYDDAIRHRDNMKHEPNSSVSSPFVAENEEEAIKQVGYHMLGLQESEGP